MQREQEIERRPAIVAEPDVSAISVEKTDVDATPQVVIARDRVRWGPIWAGLITALTTFLLIELLLYSTGALTIDLNPGAGGSNTSPWITGIAGLVAFFLGGWVAAATSAVRGFVAGLVNGFLVWGLGIVLILMFSALGLGAAFGPIGAIVNQFLFLSRNLNLGPGNVDPNQIAGIVRDAA